MVDLLEYDALTARFFPPRGIACKLLFSSSNTIKSLKVRTTSAEDFISIK